MWSHCRSAFTSLQNMITNYPSCGHDIARGILYHYCYHDNIIKHCRLCFLHITRHSRLLSDGDGELTEDVRIIPHSLEVYPYYWIDQGVVFICYTISNLLCYFLLVCRWVKSWPVCIRAFLFSSSLGWSIVINGILFLPTDDTTTEPEHYEGSQILVGDTWPVDSGMLLRGNLCYELQYCYCSLMKKL